MSHRPEIVHIHDAEHAAQVVPGELDGIPLRAVPLHELVPVAGSRPRLLLGDEDLLTTPKAFWIDRYSPDPASARFLQAIHETVRLHGSLLVNAQLDRADQLEADRLAIACRAAALGIPVAPTTAVPFGRYALHALEPATRTGGSSWVVRGRTDPTGAAARADDRGQLTTLLAMAARTGTGHVVQENVEHSDVCRVHFLAGEPVDTGDLPADLRGHCARLAGSLRPGYLCTRWLVTPGGAVLDGWSTSLSTLDAPHLRSRFGTWIRAALAQAAA
ncbi:hypothetical protein [Amycolatopsis sp. cmx-4-83]|uniref:hypothetical protein n=1 Tax=Amycolatopsis sp. cmx-4-83 TaxID=2790940 RepID=UPI00397E0EAC